MYGAKVAGINAHHLCLLIHQKSKPKLGVVEIHAK
jgi:hypothetical protein